MKKIVGFSISVCMILVIILGYAKKKDLLIFHQEKTTETIDKDAELDKEGMKIMSKRGKKSQEEYQSELRDKIKVFDMGEEGEVYDHIGITINSVYQTNHLTFIPEELNGKLTAVEQDGYTEEGFTFLVLDLTIKNKDHENYQKFNLVGFDIETSRLTACYYDGYKYSTAKDSFTLNLEPDSEFHTRLVLNTQTEKIKKNLKLIVNPRSPVYLGAAAFNVTVESDPTGDNAS